MVFKLEPNHCHFLYRFVPGVNNMDPNSTEASMYLNLATSFINAADNSADHLSSTSNEQQSKVMDGFDESDDEPLIRSQANAFNTSDDEHSQWLGHHPVYGQKNTAVFGCPNQVQ